MLNGFLYRMPRIYYLFPDENTCFLWIKEKIPNFATNCSDKNITSHQNLTHAAVFLFPKHEISLDIVQRFFNPFTVHWPLMGTHTAEGHWEVVLGFCEACWYLRSKEVFIVSIGLRACTNMSACFGSFQRGSQSVGTLAIFMQRYLY